MIIRWLGAFGKAQSLHASLKFELGRSLTDEVAAEDIRTCSMIKHAKVGLLIANKSIIKKFNGDCFSLLENGKLVKTRNPKDAKSSHLECWANPNYIGIVAKNYSNLPKQIQKTLKWFGDLYNLQILNMNNKGELTEIK